MIVVVVVYKVVVLLTGTAVAHNLARHGIKVVAAYDVDASRLATLSPDVAAAPSPRHVAAAADIVVSGKSVNQSVNL